MPSRKGPCRAIGILVYEIYEAPETHPIAQDRQPPVRWPPVCWPKIRWPPGRWPTHLWPKALRKPAEAVVIGGGIAGCTLAWELAKRGVKVELLEQTAIAAKSSGRNTGTLLSGPQKEVTGLLDACAAIYGELASGPVPFEFARIGHLLISEDEASFAAAATIADRYRAAGVAMERASGAELARDYPRLKFKVAGGYFVERAWTLEPMGATHAFAHAARQAGAILRTGVRVAQIVTRSGKVQGVLTDQGMISADLVFIANGLWMNDLLRRTVGDGPLPALPFTAGRGWLIQLGKLDFELPWIVEELTWPDQEELGKRMSLRGLADIASGRDDQPAVEAICLNPMRGGDARLGASVQPALRDLIRNTDMAARIAGRASAHDRRPQFPGRPECLSGKPADALRRAAGRRTDPDRRIVRSWRHGVDRHACRARNRTLAGRGRGLRQRQPASGLVAPRPVSRLGALVVQAAASPRPILSRRFSWRTKASAEGVWNSSREFLIIVHRRKNSGKTGVRTGPCRRSPASSPWIEFRIEFRRRGGSHEIFFRRNLRHRVAFLSSRRPMSRHVTLRRTRKRQPGNANRETPTGRRQPGGPGQQRQGQQNVGR